MRVRVTGWYESGVPQRMWKQMAGLFDRGEGFSRTGYLLPARGTPGVSPDGESSWDVAAAVVVAVIWKFRSTFWPGNHIWSLFLWNCALVEALDTRPGFCTEF